MIVQFIHTVTKLMHLPITKIPSLERDLKILNLLKKGQIPYIQVLNIRFKILVFYYIYGTYDKLSLKYLRRTV